MSRLSLVGWFGYLGYTVSCFDSVGFGVVYEIWVFGWLGVGWAACAGVLGFGLILVYLSLFCLRVVVAVGALLLYLYVCFVVCGWFAWFC